MPESLTAGDLMQREVLTAHEDDSAAELCDLFQHAHVHAAPVVDADGRLVGVVSQEDILMGSMSEPPGDEDDAGDRGDEPRAASRFPLVRDIMTSPAISVGEETSLKELCRVMWRLRIHHLPVVGDGKVLGMVSSLDVCRSIGGGEPTD